MKIACVAAHVGNLRSKAFLKHRLDPDDFDRHGGHLARLVDGKASEIFNEFVILFEHGASYVKNILDGMHPAAQEDRQFITALSAAMLFHNASSFERRILCPLNSFPLKLMKMGRIRHDLKCSERRLVAQEVLANVSKLDLSTRKMVSYFREDFELAAATGYIGLKLFVTIRAIRRLWRADVRENERLNKMLTLFGDRAPSSTLELISSRLTLKYALGVARAVLLHLQSKKSANRTDLKWSAIRPLATAVANSCLESWDEAGPVMSADARWDAPEIPSYVPTKEMVKQWMPLIDPASRPPKVNTGKVWAAAANKKLKEFIKTTTSIAQPTMAAICFSEQSQQQTSASSLKLHTGDDMFFQCEAVNLTVRFLRGTWRDEHHPEPLKPWTFVTASELFVEIYNRLNNGGVSSLAMFLVPLSWDAVTTHQVDIADPNPYRLAATARPDDACQAWVAGSQTCMCSTVN